MTWKYPNSTEYNQLVKQFPLVLVKSRVQHEQALAMLEKLAVKATISKAESDYFDVLLKLIKDYEDANITPAQVTPQEALRFVLMQRKLKHQDIAQVTQMQVSHISEFFAGKRNLPKHAAAKLGALFKVDPMIFLPKVVSAKTKAPITKHVWQSPSESLNPLLSTAQGRSLKTKKPAVSSKTKAIAAAARSQ